MERETRREKLAREKAEWEAEQLLKKEAKAAKKAAKEASKRGSKTLAEDETDTVLDYVKTPIGSAGPADAVRDDVMSISIDESSARVRRAKRVREPRAKLSLTYKSAIRAGLDPAVASMLDERDAILRKWRSGVSAEESVSALSVVSTRTPDGALWRLLPRHGGVGLVKTGMDGSIEIVEPPRKRRRWPTVVTAALFGVLVALTLWGTFWPATDAAGGGTYVTTVTVDTTAP